MATILVVDDEEPILKAIERVFADEDDIGVLSASNAPAAVKILSQEKVDVIISDERMPMVAGSEFLRFAKDKYPDIPRIILTGYADQSATIRAINNAEVFRYMSKPWLPDELIATVKKAIEHKKSHEQESGLSMRVLAQKNELESKMNELSKTVEKRNEQLSKSIELLKKQSEAIANVRVDVINLLLVTVSMYDQPSVFLGRQISALYKFMSEETDSYTEEMFQTALLSGLVTDTRKVILPVLGGLEHFSGITKTLVMMNENFNATGPSGFGGDAIPLDARLLRTLHDLFKFNSKFPGSGRDYVAKNSHVLYDARVATQVLAAHTRHEQSGRHRMVGLAELVPGMVIAQTVRLPDGREVTDRTVLDEKIIGSIRAVQSASNIGVRIPVLL